MERFNALGRGAQMMLVGAVLLFVDLFFSWQSVDLPEPFGDYTRSGWYGAAGIILGLLTIVLLAWLIVRIASVNIPLPVSTAMTAALIGTLILIFAIIKFISILGDEATFWAWIGLALAVVIAVGAFQTVQEAGGVESLQQEASALTTSAGGGAAAAAGGAAATGTGAADDSADATADAVGESGSAAGGAQEAAEVTESAPEGPMDAAQDVESGAGEALDDAADAAAEGASDPTDEPSTGASA